MKKPTETITAEMRRDAAKMLRISESLARAQIRLFEEVKAEARIKKKGFALILGRKLSAISPYAGG